MKGKGLKILHVTASVLISAALITAAVCLVLAAYTIYSSGESPYTPESIGAQYAIYKIPLLAAVGAIILGISLDLLLPKPAGKKKPIKDPFIRLRILQKKYAPVTGDSDLAAQIKKEQSLRVFLRILFSVLCAAAFVPALLSLCDYSYHTVDNLTPAILRTAALLGIGAVISAVLLLILSVLLSKSAESQIAKTKIAISDCEKRQPEAATDKGKNAMTVLRLLLVGVACALITLGSLENGFYDVLQKAIRICTECIGLG